MKKKIKKWFKVEWDEGLDIICWLSLILFELFNINAILGIL